MEQQGQVEAALLAAVASLGCCSLDSGQLRDMVPLWPWQGIEDCAGCYLWRPP